MAKGPQNDKTGARAQTGASKSGSSKSAASKTQAAKSSAAKKPARKASPKRAVNAQSGPKSQSASRAQSASGAKTRSSKSALNKAALKAAFEKAMRGRSLDEAEDAFDDALDDFYSEQLAGSGFDDTAEESLSEATFRGHAGGLGAGSQSGEMGNLLDFYSRMLDAQGCTGGDMLNDMTQGFGMVLGSGPAFAALESMLSNVSAQGAVLMNAVQTQRQLDQIGLCCTSECVKQLMSLNNGFDSD